MRLNRYLKYFKSFFIFGLILFLGFSLPDTTVVARADETQEVKLNVNTHTMVKGKTFSLYVYNLSEGQTVSYVSSSPAVASVSAGGTITANQVGNATVIATVTEEGDTIAVLSCAITVGPPAVVVRFSRSELSMTVGQKITLERLVLPLNTAESVKFSSHDKSIATVSAGGRVTAKSEGSTYIFAQIDNGWVATCKINVSAAIPEEPVAEINFEEFITNLNNADGKAADSAESTTG